jgi:hypothetical protein
VVVVGVAVVVRVVFGPVAEGLGAPVHPATRTRATHRRASQDRVIGAESTLRPTKLTYSTNSN